MPPFIERADYQCVVIDREEVEFESIEVDLHCDSEVIVKAFIHYVFYDDDFFLSRVLDEFIPEEDMERAAQAVDVWFGIYLDRFEEVFARVKDFDPMRVSDVKIKQRSVLLEFTYEEFIDAT
jgi:hypothetical protein